MFSRTTFQGIVGLTLTILRGRGKGHQCTLEQILVIWKRTESIVNDFQPQGVWMIAIGGMVKPDVICFQS